MYGDSENWQQIIDIFPDMNFDEEIEKNPEISNYLR